MKPPRLRELLAVLLVGCVGPSPAGDKATEVSKIPVPKDNSLCLVCHPDFEEESLAADHLAQKITCASCHGVSMAHQSDEMQATKPDILFGRSEVESLCRKCHQEHKSPPAVAAFRKQWLGKHRPNGRAIQEESICSDCHGVHIVIRLSQG